MPLVTLGLPNHDTLPGVSANDHHTATVGGDLNLADLAEKDHASLESVTSDQHHAQAHAATHGLAGNDNLALPDIFALVQLFGN